MRWLPLLLIACGTPATDETTDTDTDVVLDDPICQRIASDYGDMGTEALDVEVFAGGLQIPWSLAFLPGGDLLVTERDGDVLRVSSEGVVSPTPVITVNIDPAGEGGLLGMALDPDFATNRAFYLYYTDGAFGGTNRVERFLLSGDGTSATSDAVILDDIPVGQFHNGGRLRFGPDGKLYIGTGDARDPDLSQDKDSLAGKLLRVNADGSVPSDNPFGNATWVYGIRNTQGFDWWDNGKLVITDHGPSGELDRTGHDEVQTAEAGDNLGWPTIYRCQEEDGMRAPAMTWADAMPPGGTAIYTGTEIPAFADDVFIGVLGFGDDVGHLHRIRFDASGNVTLSEQYLRGDHGRIRDVIMGPDGKLWATTSNCDGRSDLCGDGDVILRIGRD